VLYKSRRVTGGHEMKDIDNGIKGYDSLDGCEEGWMKRVRVEGKRSSVSVEQLSRRETFVFAGGMLRFHMRRRAVPKAQARSFR